MKSSTIYTYINKILLKALIAIPMCNLSGVFEEILVIESIKLC